MSRYIRNASFLSLGLLLLSAVSVAQLQFGEVQLSGTGNVTAGYNAAFGDQIQSNHGMQFGGGANISGSYYNPRFLSFDLRPFYNQSRANSNVDAIYDSSGINANAQIFSGSHFPGAVGFSDFHNKRSTFGLANGPELATNGDGRGWNVAWSELVPGLPTFTAAYSVGTGSGSILGTDQRSSNDTRNLFLRSGYTLKGFRMTGTYQRTSLTAKTPGFLVGTQEIDSTGKTDTLAFQVTHRFPLHGNAYGYVSRSHFSNSFEGENQGRTTTDIFNGGVFMIPTPKSSVGFSGTYSDNLFGALNQTIATSGIAPPLSLGGASHNYSVSANGSYAILSGLYASANVTHVGQVYWGQSHASTYFTGTLYGNYQKPLFGLLNWSVGVIDNANQEGNTNVGLNTSVNATRRFNSWEVGGDVGYQQNVQTLLVGYTTSSYRWGGHVNRRQDRWYWSAGFGGSQSVLNVQKGSGNHSENVFSALGTGRYALNLNVSQAAGTSVLTSSGLQSVTIPPGILPTPLLILYNAHSYGFSATAMPKRSLTILTSYSKATSTISSDASKSYDSTGLFTANIEYHARRLNFSAGASRFSQSVATAAGTPPANVNSYYFGVSRWFGFF